MSSLILSRRIIMLDGKKLVEMLDSYLKDNGLSRKQFCDDMGIPNSTLATWKSKNTLPPLETVDKIARYMKVSLTWLIHNTDDDISINTPDDPTSRISIYYRIENQLKSTHSGYNYEESMIAQYLSDIVDPLMMLQWSQGRIDIPDETLPKIADKLKVSIQWLMTGESYRQQDFNSHLYEVAKQHQEILLSIDSLGEEEIKFIREYLNLKMWYKTYFGKEEMLEK